MGSSADHRTHFVLVPFLAQGHIIPMVDLGLLLADRGMLVTLVTTPLNASRLQPTIDHARDSNLPIHLVQLRFPCAEAGLPEGYENLDLFPPSVDMVVRFMEAMFLLEDPLRQYLHDRPLLPTCLISDFCNPWTRRVTSELKIPRYVFYSVCCFTLYCHCILPPHYEKQSVTDEHEPFLIPGLPHQVEATRAKAPGFFYGSTPLTMKYREAVREAEATAEGIVVNTFEEMEPMYVEMYAGFMGKEVWPVGPVSLVNKDFKAARGASPSVDADEVLRWLDSKGPRSVIYVCLGSLVRVHPRQVREIGLGLEASGVPFVWVIRGTERMPEVDAWLAEEGFEERTRGLALVIRGWAPQVVILSHGSVGGFVTHCGWNSCMEGVAAGVPMGTWPCFGDQFLNERLVVDVLRTGVAVGVKRPTSWLDEEAADQVVRREEVTEAVRRLMDEGEEGEERKKRAWELRVKAMKAMEIGGSSSVKMGGLIDDASEIANKAC